jgi:hypothetical protein
MTIEIDGKDVPTMEGYALWFSVGWGNPIKIESLYKENLYAFKEMGVNGCPLSYDSTIIFIINGEDIDGMKKRRQKIKQYVERKIPQIHIV